MHRRVFMKAVLAGTAAGGLTTAGAAATDAAAPLSDRAYWSGLLERIARPVLANMSKGQLQQRMTVEVGPHWDGRDRRVAFMEGFGRLMSGLAPWLTLPDDASAEGRVRRELRQQALASYAHSVDPKSPDYLLWRKEGQPLVDSAYFAQALLRAPKELWVPLDKTTKARIVTELKGLRRVPPPYTNWLLFAAMNEAFLLSIGEQYDPIRLAVAIKKMAEWYVGDGWYSDGPRFHFDYYNSYVIQPMLLMILDVLEKTGADLNWHGESAKQLRLQALARMQRYGEHLERMISPDGAFSPHGRSATYRTAVFQPLALLAWRKSLPATLPEGRVRAALTAVHKRIFAYPTNFTSDGYLTLGFAGHRPEIADGYSNTGSMYITTESFLPLALPPDDTFWTAKPDDWTAKRAYSNEPFENDHYLDV